MGCLLPNSSGNPGFVKVYFLGNRFFRNPCFQIFNLSIYSLLQGINFLPEFFFLFIRNIFKLLKKNSVTLPFLPIKGNTELLDFFFIFGMKLFVPDPVILLFSLASYKNCSTNLRFLSDFFIKRKSTLVSKSRFSPSHIT